MRTLPDSCAKNGNHARLTSSRQSHETIERLKLLSNPTVIKIVKGIRVNLKCDINTFIYQQRNNIADW